MFYKTDFVNNLNTVDKLKVPHYQNYENMQKRFRQRRVLYNANQRNDVMMRKCEVMESYWEHFCQQTSIHGIRYLAQKELNWIERITWFILVIWAIIGVVYVSHLLSNRFKDSLLATVIESVTYPVSEMSYPAVTICNNNRVNWQRVELAKKIFVPNADTETMKAFDLLLIAIENIEFAEFDRYSSISNSSARKLDHINMTHLVETVMHTCEDIFTDNVCWWRNKFVPCCDYFFLQKSEFGLCYSFNSAINDAGQYLINNFSYYPWRTSNHGDWSGLKFNVNSTPATRRLANNRAAGFLVAIHDPEEWPSARFFVRSGTTTAVKMIPDYYYVTDGVERLTLHQRNCMLSNSQCKESSVTLPGLRSILQNCISQCRQNYLVQYCNCSLDFMYPIGNYTACNVTGLVCLSKYNNIFNHKLPPFPSEHFDNDDEGILCKCYPQCDRIEYNFELASIALSDSESDVARFDVHFKYNTIVKYRTDVIFGWLDLIVAFGGIAGLFLGCSLLSVVELLYYGTYGFFVFYRKHKFKPVKVQNTQLLTENKLK